MYVPENEQELVGFFLHSAWKYGWRVKKLGTPFPDAIIEKDGRDWRVEFEYKSSNFFTHGHDADGCDLIICWEDDLGGIAPVPIIALSDYRWMEKRPLEEDDKATILWYWRNRALAAEYSLSVSLKGAKLELPEEYKTQIDSHPECVSNKREVMSIKYNYRWEPFAKEFYSLHPYARAVDLAICMSMAVNDGRSHKKFLEKARDLHREHSPRLNCEDSGDINDTSDYEQDAMRKNNEMRKAFDVYEAMRKHVIENMKNERDQCAEKGKGKAESIRIPAKISKEKTPPRRVDTELEDELIALCDQIKDKSHNKWMEFSRVFVKLALEKDESDHMRKYMVASLADRMSIAECGTYNEEVAYKRKSQASRWVKYFMYYTDELNKPTERIETVNPPKRSIRIVKVNKPEARPKLKAGRKGTNKSGICLNPNCNNRTSGVNYCSGACKQKHWRIIHSEKES